jgi:hypothetical protein
MKKVILVVSMKCIDTFQPENSASILEQYRKLYPSKEVEFENDGDIIIND